MEQARRNRYLRFFFFVIYRRLSFIECIQCVSCVASFLGGFSCVGNFICHWIGRYGIDQIDVRTIIHHADSLHNVHLKDEKSIFTHTSNLAFSIKDNIDKQKIHQIRIK